MAIKKKNSYTFKYQHSWFKELSDEHIQETCKAFGITPEVFNHAGKLDKSTGRISIDLLKLSFPNPEDWKYSLESVNSLNFRTLYDLLKNTSDTAKIVDIVISMYNVFVRTRLNIYKQIKDNVESQLKEISTRKNIKVDITLVVRVDIFKKCVCELMKKILDDEESIDVKESVADTIYKHCKIFLEDYNIINKS